MTATRDICWDIMHILKVGVACENSTGGEWDGRVGRSIVIKYTIQSYFLLFFASGRKREIKY